MLEAQNMLERFGDKEALIEKTLFSGIILVKTSLDNIKVLDNFWRMHDPTTLNRQENDVGTQYRSAIFVHSEEQQELAIKSKQEVSPKFSRPIVTEIVPLGTFYPAEDYHQNYYRQHPENPYCQVIITPKLQKLELP